MAILSAMNTSTLLTSSDVVRRSGLSYRQLDYWTRAEFIEPVVEARGSGSSRLFDETVLDVIAERLVDHAAHIARKIDTARVEATDS